MNDRQDPYGQGAGHPQPAQIYGYDEYGRPLYVPADPQQQPHQPQQPSQPPGYDTYGGGVPYDYGTGQGTAPQPQVHEGYDYGAYQGQQPTAPPPGHAPGSAPGQPQGFDPFGHGGPGTAHQPVVPPQAQPQPHRQPHHQPQPQPQPQQAAAPPRGGAQRAYETEQFAFVDDQDEESEDVIDWLKFTESRTERREEAKRRGRVRRRLLVVTLVLAVVGGAAFLWATDRLPGVPGLGSTEETAAPGAQVRDVIVVHLRETGGDATSTALLVANETTERGTTLLLPNELSLTSDGVTTTLGQAVAESSAGEVREGLGSLLGADIKGTWRLDSPYLEALVDGVGGITLDTDAEVPSPEGEGEDPLVTQGRNVPLGGQAAVAYALHQAEGEAPTAQLERFGQVMAALLTELPPTRDGATEVVRALRLIPDPSLPEDELGASLGQLAGYAQAGDGGHDTTPVPVQEDGTLSDETADGLLGDVLGGTVTNPDPGGASRIGIRDATGVDDSGQDARIALINGGFTVVDSRAVEDTEETSRITYADPAHRETALDAARTLGLPEEAVTEGERSGNADVLIVLGGDYPDAG
ncbi:LytR C-terminal domain-containing protein [Streptomyces sp. 4N509B]|uniref:LytR C-terminal domain-containing protein n=1 Tax=Streptomyces sp. 4N509B TaxID=3457413 RepID=UPI003FCF56E8